MWEIQHFCEAVFCELTHWCFGDSDLDLRRQREEALDERRLANVAPANKTHLKKKTTPQMSHILLCRTATPSLLENPNERWEEHNSTRPPPGR